MNALRQDPYLFTLTPQLTCIECFFFLMFIAHKAQSLANMWDGGGRDCKYQKKQASPCIHPGNPVSTPRCCKTDPKEQ